MIYYLNVIKTKNEIGQNLYTEETLKVLIKRNGHTITENIDNADIVLISACDVMQIFDIEKFLIKYPNKKIVIGGHAAYYYKLFSLFADYVNIGQGFEFFKLKTIADIENAVFIYTKNSEIVPTPSSLIEFELFPIVQLSKKVYSYMGSVGCKNKCKFCMTSNVQKHQKNDKERVKRAEEKIKKIGGSINIITNDSENESTNRKSQSIMLKDFLNIQPKPGSQYRIGIEFATEINRKKYGKPFTDEIFVSAIVKALEYGAVLRLFCITGIDSYSDWDKLIKKIPEIYSKGSIFFKFTNIIYEPFTMIHNERFNINVENFFDNKKVMKLIQSNKIRCAPLKSMFCANPIRSIIKSGLNYCHNINEYLVLKKLFNDKDIESSVNYLKRTLFNNQYPNNYITKFRMNKI